MGTAASNLSSKMSEPAIQIGNYSAKTTSLNLPPEHLERACFGAGCFWGTEKFMRNEFPKGIHNTLVGYCGGKVENPNYRQVCSGSTGHAEALLVEFDPTKIQYRSLVDFFFRFHDPTTLNRQGNDVGSQYRSAVFYYNDEQKSIAQQVKQEMEPKWKRPITTTFEKADIFYPAEEYHQRYT
jgi:peptide-methionine (S)-S-oxide reductase